MAFDYSTAFVIIPIENLFPPTLNESVPTTTTTPSSPVTPTPTTNQTPVPSSSSSDPSSSSTPPAFWIPLVIVLSVFCGCLVLCVVMLELFWRIRMVARKTTTPHDTTSQSRFPPPPPRPPPVAATSSPFPQYRKGDQATVTV